MPSPWNNDPNPGSVPATEPRREERGRASGWLEAMRRHARDKPLQSMTIALVAGWLIGRWSNVHHGAQ